MPTFLDLWNRIPSSTQKILLGSAVGMAFASPLGYQKLLDIRVALGVGLVGGGVISWVTGWDAKRSVDERVEQSSDRLAVPTATPFAQATQHMIQAIASQDPDSPEFQRMLNLSAIVMSGAAQAFSPVTPPQNTPPAVDVQAIFGEGEPEEESLWDEPGNVVSIQQKPRQVNSS